MVVSLFSAWDSRARARAEMLLAGGDFRARVSLALCFPTTRSLHKESLTSVATVEFICIPFLPHQCLTNEEEILSLLKSDLVFQ